MVSPVSVAPLVNRRRLDAQLRAKNDSGASAWSPTAWLPPRRRMRSVLAVVLPAVIIIVVALVAGREGLGSTAPRKDRDTTVAFGDKGAEEADGKLPRADDGTGAQGGDGNAAVSEGPVADPAEGVYPRISSLVRKEPSDYRTSADSVTWRITFTEAVTNVDRRDFAIVGRTWQPTVRMVGESANVYDIVLDSRGLAEHSGTVTLSLSRGMYIKNLDGNRVLNMNADGPYEASFVIDNTAPTVIFNPETGRIGDVGGNLILSFSEAVYSDSGRTAFTEATLAGLIDLKEDDENGGPIPFTASIDRDDDTVTIDPTAALPLVTWVRVRNAYHDTVGNAGLQTTAIFTVDTIRPTVTIDGVPDTDSGSFMARFRFSEPVTGLHRVRRGRHQRYGERGYRGTGRPAVVRADHADRRLPRRAACRPGDRSGRQRQHGVDHARRISRRRRHRSAAGFDRAAGAGELAYPRRLDHMARDLQ